ncbi:MAG: Gfo/Idh/MocA family oxidoreductase [Bacteroidales bacterium]|jgi:predicted dehydrogenase|nr:Gfo/Idh/MocA family oxidoreductase [Bacteroidales bacterium]
MGKPQIRTGIIGSGYAAGFHYEALRRIYSVDVDIRGAYSPTCEKLKSFTESRGLKAWPDAESLIDECDIVHVCTPPSSHEQLVVMALGRNRNVIVEKPFTGYFGDGSDNFNGDIFPRITALGHAMASAGRMLEAERKSSARIMYAENWIYAPAVVKEKEIIEKTGCQILWMHGEESHSGSHSSSYGQWKYSGGGSMIGKGCHPLSAALYFKQVEGKSRSGKAIRPASITARTHALTRMKNFVNLGHLRTSYSDIEDFALMHVVFEDGTFADIFASELVMGGVSNRIELNTSNHRTICNISPNNAMQAYTPDRKYFNDVYVVEKTETKEGWSSVSPDEAWFTGYQHEMEAFYGAAVSGEPVESGSMLAADVTATIYAGYLSAEKKGSETAIPLI